jgi:outer membrane immunogenic protein
VYATGGYAGGNVHAWDALAGGAGTKFLSGWSAGAGVQTLLTSNLALKFEYLHTDLGSAGLFNVVPGVMETVSFSGDIFRVGLDWRFGNYAPAYAGPIYTK